MNLWFGLHFRPFLHFAIPSYTRQRTLVRDKQIPQIVPSSLFLRYSFAPCSL